MPGTRDVVLRYLERVRARDGWEDLLSDDLEFTNFSHPVKRTTGKAASLEGIARFYGMVDTMELRSIVVEGQVACALTRYELRPPSGRPFESHIAEVFVVRDGRISSFDIYFDSTPYPKPGSVAS